MPYSITTKDGITLQGIPDDIPVDHPDLKARVAAIRGQKPPEAPAGNAADGGKLAGYGMGLRDPIDAGAQMLRRAVPEGVGAAVDSLGNWLASKGLPVAPSTGVAGVDKIVVDKNRQYEADRVAAGRDGFDWSRAAGNVINPVTASLPSAAGAKTVGQLAKVGAAAGAVSGALQPVVEDVGDFWTAKAKQGAAGAAAGATLTPALSKLAERAAPMVSRAVQSTSARNSGPVNVGGLSRTDLDAAVAQVLQSQGLRMEDAPGVILNSVRGQIAQAVSSGGKLDPAMALRQAQAEAIGLTGDAALTAGQMTRNPLQWAREKNLSGIMFDTPNGPQNPLAARFASQNSKLQGVFDNLGANRAGDRVADGDLALATLQAANKTADDNVRAAYTAFRNATGRDLEVPLQGLAQDYASVLDTFGETIPAAVRRKFEALGVMSGRQRQGMTLEGAENLIKVINANTDPANKPAFRALGELRGAMQRAISEAADSAPSGAGAEAAMLAKEARSTAAGVFKSRREIPALQAAADDVAPDSFFQRFLLNRSAPTREVEGMATILQQSPEAWQQVRGQVASYLKQAAFGNNLAGDKTIAAERFASAIANIGPQKLAIIFSPDEVVRLNIAAKVAAEMESVPAGAKGALNSSGTAAGVFNLLQGLGNSRLLRNIPGARSLANQAGQIANEQAAQTALRGAPATVAPPPAQASAELQRALRLLFAPTAAGVGAAAGQAFQ